jgi:pimeloyl-ACP methyl ester carboxylesterase
MPRTLLVVHDAGDAAAGGRWRQLTDAWPGPALAPDLPGHGSAPPPEGATYAPADAAIVVDQTLHNAGLVDTEVVILGHGWGGFAAELFAAAGRAVALVLVDGLGGPWRSYPELVADQHRYLRDVFADPKALAPPDSVPDPRLAHPFPSVWERAYVAGLRDAIEVPVLALETPASPTPRDECDERLGDFAGEARIIEISEASAAAVTDALRTAGFFQK